MEPWSDYRRALLTGLEAMVATDRDGQAIDVAQAFDRWVALTQDIHEAGRALYLIGNGASAMMASHMAADACKNGGLRAMAFNDPALLTAIGNDVAFDQLFSLPLHRLAHRGDLLISISSSGNSPNIIRALEAARDIGMHLVTLSGKQAENRSRALGDLNFYVPLPRYGWVESAHQLIIHYWFDQYLNRYGQGAV
jgi:D-sedoheptulose 7-phosphate isomerase